MVLERAESGSNFDVLFYGNPQPMWIFDVTSLLIIDVNNAAIKQYGYSRSEFLTKSIKDLRPEEDISELEQVLKTIRGNNSYKREFRHKDKNGKIFFVEVISYKINHKGVSARLVHAHNITYQKNIAGKLQITQNKLMQILETTAIGFMQLGFDWKVTYWNKAAENLIGYKHEHVIGKNFWKVLPEIFHSDFYTYYNLAMSKRLNTDFTGYFWPMQRWFACNAYPADDGIIVHFRDITNRKQAEEDLVQKIEQLKEISYLNSHAIRKPIASLLGLTNLFKEQIINESEFKDVISHIYNCSVELDDVVRAVNDKVSEEHYIAPLRFTLEEFSFKQFLEAVVKQAQTYSPKHRISIKSVNDIIYYGNKYGIEQAAKNLIINAIKFSPSADTILVWTEVINQNLVLSVQDFGRGMNEDTIDRIFMSLSRKEYHKAARSGLPQVSDVCHRHHGSMWIESQIDKGTTISMRLPLSNVAMFRITGHPDFSIYQGAGVHIKHDKVNNYLYLKWSRFQDLHTIKDGCAKVLNAIQETGCSCLLNDNTDIIGPWDDAIDWVAKEWFPQIYDAGLRYMAWVFSPSTFCKLSALHTVQLIESDICIKSFSKPKLAIEWLTNSSKSDCLPLVH